MSTTDHPVVKEAQAALRDAGHALEEDARLGWGAALKDATDSRLVWIVAERALERMAGIEVVLHDAASAAAFFAAADYLDEEPVYGPSTEAILGLMRAAVECDEGMVRAVGYNTHAPDTLYQQSFGMADGLGVSRLAADVCSDMHFACFRPGVDTPPKVQRHLRGVRGFELAALYYVLTGAGWRDSTGPELLRPIQRVFFPEWPRV